MATKLSAAARKEAIRDLARDKYARDGELEIDHGAKVSEGSDDGAYVQAWVWVDLSDTALSKRGG
jgi:hypothetical protein